MVTFQRLIFLALVAFSAWLPASSFSAVPSVSGYEARWFGTVWGRGGTPEAACADAAAAVQENTYGADSATRVTQSSGDVCWYGVGGARTWNIGISAVSVCPSNSVDVGGVCTCNTGYSESAGSCVIPPGLCDWAAGIRSKFYHHRYDGRAGDPGRLHALEDRALATADDLTSDRYHSLRLRHRPGRFGRHRQALDLKSSDPGGAALVRRHPAGCIHE